MEHEDDRQTPTLQAIPLSNAITLYQSNSISTTANPSNDDGPNLIIVCAWFRALPKHTIKYITTYHQHYPHAQILLLQSNIGDMLYTTYSTQRKGYLPVLDLIKSLRTTDQPPKILLHIFSNGGSNSAVQLASAWTQQHSSTPLPISAIVFDSAPGSPSLSLAAKAIVSSFPPQARWWVSIVVYLFIIPIIALPNVFPGRKNLIDMLRARLNDPVFFPRSAPRVYFCSPADSMVPVGDVVAHREAAANAGFGAEVVRFGRSGHVAHVREDGGRYWGVVWGLWEGRGR